MKLKKYSLVHEIFEAAAKGRLKSDKVEILKYNDCVQIRDYLRCFYDDRVQFALPEGTPPYTPAGEHTAPTNLMRKNKELQYLVKGIPACDRMPKMKREQKFIELLEGVHPKDAELLIDMVNKNTPKGISKEVVKEAFPGLLPD